MRNGEATDDGFTLVTHKQGSRRTRRSAPSLVPESARTTETTVPKDVVLKQVRRAHIEVNASKFLSSALKSLDAALKQTSHTRITDLLCYGLGRYSECTIARYQLGFLLSLKEHYACRVQIYDPLFTQTELDLLPEKFDCKLITENEEGKRTLTSTGCTLVYTPHCPKQLTNNFLWANWSTNLQNCIILGNSFVKVIFNPTCLIESAEYILKISPYTTEHSLANIFKFKDVFNDLAFHVFNVENPPENFWTRLSAPVYPENDTGILIKKA